MPVFNYSAKDETGQTISGQVVASDARMAAHQVRGLGYFPMNVRPGGLGGLHPENGGQAIPSMAQGPQNFQSTGSTLGQTGSQFDLNNGSAIGQTVPLGGRQRLTDQSALGTPFVQPYGSWVERTFIFPLWTGVSLTDLALFYRQFSAMLGAGMTITNALAALGREANPGLRIAVFHINKHVSAGGKLSEGMAMFPHIFTRVDREMIAASESTGGLDAVMVRLSTYLEAEAALKRMIKRETFMPKVNFVATFLLPTLVVAIMQGMTAYFQQAVLPLLRILADMGALYVAGRYALKIEPVAVVYDAIKAYLPYFGTTVRMIAIAKFSRALSSLYSSGVLIPTAVDISARTSGNAFLTSQMRKTVPAMMAGSGMTEAFRQTGVFPSMFISMIGTGEHTGALDQTLNKLAEYYEAESAIRLHQSVQALNVLIFLVVAVIVGIEVIHFWTGYANQFTNMMSQDQ